jgi:predicted metal-dependent hydrolase
VNQHGTALETLTVTLGITVVRCSVIRTAARRLSITVFPDQRVLVCAPQSVGLDEVQARAQKRARWIVRQIDRFERFQPIQPPRQYLNGETHLLMGRQYRLRILPSNRFFVDLNGRYIVVHSRHPKDRTHIGRMMDRWYHCRARRVLENRFDACWEKFRHNRMPRPRLRLYRMKNRWGSCTTAGTITLNRDLVKAPVFCVDYAITHELCHLQQHNHGKAFYAALRRCMPDWERRKDRLDAAMAFFTSANEG